MCFFWNRARFYEADPSSHPQTQPNQETEELIEGEAMEIYGPHFYRPEQAERRRRQVGKADSPIVTSEAIEHALFSRYPRTRYVVANFDGMPGGCMSSPSAVFFPPIESPVSSLTCLPLLHISKPQPGSGSSWPGWCRTAWPTTSRRCSKTGSSMTTT